MDWFVVTLSKWKDFYECYLANTPVNLFIALVKIKKKPSGRFLHRVVNCYWTTNAEILRVNNVTFLHAMNIGLGFRLLSVVWSSDFQSHFSGKEQCIQYVFKFTLNLVSITNTNWLANVLVAQ